MNKKVRDIFPFFKSPNFKKYASFSLLAVLLIAIPLLVYEITNLQNTQTINQHAAWVVPQTQTYYCNSALTVTLALGGIGGNYSVAESPDCSSGFNKVSSFQSSVIIKQKSGSVGAYAVHWMWAQFWCQNPNASPCLDNGSGQEHVVGLDTAQNPTIVAQSDVRQANAPYTGQACGVYQNDFGFYITDNSDPNKTHLCTTNIVLSTSGLGNRNDNASWCNTQTQCIVQSTPTPTPTHIPTPTDTPIPSATPTVPPSDTPTIIPSDTPTETPTPGLTITPTDTPTMTPTGTLTPTNTPTPTTPNQPTNTPVAPTVTPKPTLPPTGPGNVFVSTGLVGAAIVVIGLVFAIGL